MVFAKLFLVPVFLGDFSQWEPNTTDGLVKIFKFFVCLFLISARFCNTCCIPKYTVGAGTFESVGLLWNLE